MSDALKHECAVAMLRLRKGRQYYAEKYGTEDYGLNKLILLLEKQHNRGQDGAGVASLQLHPQAGTPSYHLEKSASSSPLAELIERVDRRHTEFGGELLLGHLRYATFGRNDLSCCHPFVHESTCLSRLLLLAGNFNLTSNRELFERFIASGHYPSSRADGYLLLQTIAHYLEKENDAHPGEVSLERILRQALTGLDGAFTLCGMTGSGEAFAIRDAHGIRPGYYYVDDEVVCVASERPAIQAAFDCSVESVRELPAGQALLLGRGGEVSLRGCLPPAEVRRCVFERIYFSRANDAEIHHERKELGRRLVPALLEATGHDFAHTLFSYIPNSAQVSFHGMLECLNQEACRRGTCVRFGQIAVKDAKFRTFIADVQRRKELYQHVYDVTYGLVEPGSDALVVLDDSIVRGNTMRNAILPMLDRLGPRKIVVASSAPPVKYPDCYGIDMATAGELVAFQAAISLLEGAGRGAFIRETIGRAAASLEDGSCCGHNYMRDLYEAVGEGELEEEIARLLRPAGLRAELQVVFQTCGDLRASCPEHLGDWYFTGDYPTPGGFRVVNQALVNYGKHCNERAY